MAQITNDARNTLHGNSQLYEGTSFDISPCYSPQGSKLIPLGHNSDNRGYGFAFDLAKGSNTPGHQIFFGATRSGKGVSSIIPALLTTISSCVCIDPKGELAWITAPRRRALGQRVVILDPWNEVNERYGNQAGVIEEITKFNPLSNLDSRSRDFNDDIMALADALIVVDPNEKDSHWNNAAKGLIAGLIAAVVETKPGTGSLRDLRALITMDDASLIKQIHAIRDVNPKSLAARKLRRFAITDEKGNPVVTKEISSIRSTAETQTDLLDSETLLSAMETNDPPFNLEELVSGFVTVYLVLPPDRLFTHGRWLRMILTMALRMVARQRKPPALPVLFVLDEMGTIGNLQMIEASYGLLAGLGVRLAAYLQDISQLKRDYPRSWETFISNSSVIGVLQCGDDGTAQYVSKYLGTMTLKVDEGYSQKTRPRGDGDPNRDRGLLHAIKLGAADNLSTGGPGDPMFRKVAQAAKNEEQVTRWEADVSYHGRQVLLPEEVRNVGDDKLILMVPGKFNLRLQRFFYYSDPVLSRYARPDPNYPAAAIKQPVAAAPQPQPAANDNLSDVGKKAGEVLGNLFGKKR